MSFEYVPWRTDWPSSWLNNRRIRAREGNDALAVTHQNRRRRVTEPPPGYNAPIRIDELDNEGHIINTYYQNRDGSIHQSPALAPLPALPPLPVAQPTPQPQPQPLL